MNEFNFVTCNHCHISYYQKSKGKPIICGNCSSNDIEITQVSEKEANELFTFDDEKDQK